MHPVITVLHWHGVSRPLGGYGALMALAMLVGAVVTVRAAAKAELDVGAMISTLAAAVGIGLVGAYLTQVLVLWPQLGTLAAALARPGVVFYGGVVAGGLAFAGVARLLELPVARALDAALPGLPLAHAIGRIGCFLGGCCYGAPSQLPWTVTYGHPLAPASYPLVARHPWPLYEAAGLLVLAVVFASPRRFALRPGRRAALYVAAYAVLRCALEPLRGDRVRGLVLHDVSVSQLVSIALFAGALAILRALPAARVSV
jgi:phosphatidylglycerol:prolipoprotein diacylglycerol transferase